MCEHAIAHSYMHARARAYAVAERTCDSAHEDVSRHRHIWPLYRVNVRSNALLNNVRPYARTDERRTFTSLSRLSESNLCERMNGRAIEHFRSTVVQLLAEFRVRAFDRRTIDFSVYLIYYCFGHRNRLRKIVCFNS